MILKGKDKSLMKDRAVLEDSYEFLLNSPDFDKYHIKFILSNNKLEYSVFAIDEESLISFNPYSNEEIYTQQDWMWNIDNFFELLEDNQTIEYMTLDTHLAFHKMIDKEIDDISATDGLNKYIEYCKINNITANKFLLLDKSFNVDIQQYATLKTNLGYEIINELKVGNRIYVMGRKSSNKLKLTPFATWESNGLHVYGHSSYHQAIKDICSMACDRSKEIHNSQHKLLESNFMSVSICDIPAIHTYARIDKDIIPFGLNYYEIRHQDNDGTLPCQIKEHILVNHYGSIISKSKLPLKDGYLDIDENNFIEHDTTIRLKEYMKISETKKESKEQKKEPTR